jgi:hypothetical protein
MKHRFVIQPDGPCVLVIGQLGFVYDGVALRMFLLAPGMKYPKHTYEEDQQRKKERQRIYDQKRGARAREKRRIARASA